MLFIPHSPFGSRNLPSHKLDQFNCKINTPFLKCSWPNRCYHKKVNKIFSVAMKIHCNDCILTWVENSLEWKEQFSMLYTCRYHLPIPKVLNKFARKRKCWHTFKIFLCTTKTTNFHITTGASKSFLIKDKEWIPVRAEVNGGHWGIPPEDSRTWKSAHALTFKVLIR